MRRLVGVKSLSPLKKRDQTRQLPKGDSGVRLIALIARRFALMFLRTAVITVTTLWDCAQQYLRRHWHRLGRLGAPLPPP